MKTPEKFIHGTLYPQPSPFRTVIAGLQSPPAVFLSEYQEKNFSDTAFRIIAEEGPVGYLCLKQHPSRRGRQAQVTLSVLGSEPKLLTNNGRITTSEYMGKGYGLAAYLIAIESLAEQSVVLRSGAALTRYSLSLWHRLTRAGVSTCLSKPYQMKLEYKNNSDMEPPPFYRAAFRSRTLAEMAVGSSTHGLHTEVGSNF